MLKPYSFLILFAVSVIGLACGKTSESVEGETANDGIEGPEPDVTDTTDQGNEGLFFANDTGGKSDADTGDQSASADADWASDNTESRPPGTQFCHKHNAQGCPGSVVMSKFHSCLLSDSKETTCWGRENYKRVPAGFEFQQITAGFDHTCGLLKSGKVKCWGGNRVGQSDPPDEKFVQIDAGRGHTCGITVAGEVTCWPKIDPHEESPGPHVEPEPFEQVSVADRHACAVNHAGDIECWYDSSVCSIEEGLQRRSCVLSNEEPEQSDFVQVQAGEQHTCALTKDGDVHCWGWYDGSEFEDRPRKEEWTCDPHVEGDCPRITPTKIDSNHIEKLTVGAYHNCAITKDMNTFCWGENDLGQLQVPTESFREFESVTAGYEHTCGVTLSGRVRCWGDNNYGEADAPQ